MLFGPNNEGLDHCLTCGAKVTEFTFKVNNGVCDRCPRLTKIGEQFWKVIMARAGQGDLNAQETIEKYMHQEEK